MVIPTPLASHNQYRASRAVGTQQAGQLGALGGQVKDRVDAEHEHLHPAVLHGSAGGGGLVGAQADVLDDTLGLQVLGVLQLSAAQQVLIAGLGVHKVDHADVHIVGVQPGEEVLKEPLAVVQIPGAAVLAVLPGRADVPLENHLLPAAFQGCTQVGAYVGLGHEDVQNIDALLHSLVHYGVDGLGVLTLQILAAQANLADLKAGASQRTVFHKEPLLSVVVVSIIIPAGRGRKMDSVRAAGTVWRRQSPGGRSRGR